MLGVAMIKNILRESQNNKNLADTQAAETEDAVNTGAKKKSLKRQLILVLIFFLLTAIGFAGMALMATDNSNGKKLQGPYRQFAGEQTHSQSFPPPAAPQSQQATVQSADGKKQRAERTRQNAEERDVFREFYIGHAGLVTKGVKGSAMHLEQNLPDLARLLNGNSGVQALSPVQTLNNATTNEQPLEVKIYGITCIGQNDLPDDKCVAITSEGVLKRGDKLGSETVFAVNKTSFATSKRTVEFN
jgi:hypothetical protein